MTDQPYRRGQMPWEMQQRRHALLHGLRYIESLDFNATEWAQIMKRVAEMGCEGSSLPDYANREDL